MPTFDPNAKQPEYAILDGDYPFLIVGVEEKLSQGPKTRGYDTRIVSLDVYSDLTFTTKLATVKDTLIDHPKSDWKYSVLAKTVRYPVENGKPFDITQHWCGYRGWAHFHPEPDKTDPKKKWNRVGAYLADRPKIDRAVLTSEAAGAEDDVPF